MQLEQAASALEAIKLVRPDPEAVARANRAAAARLYIDFLPVRRFLTVTTSTRALQAGGAV
jgi:hypothetical protein